MLVTFMGLLVYKRSDKESRQFVPLHVVSINATMAPILLWMTLHFILIVPLDLIPQHSYSEVTDTILFELNGKSFLSKQWICSMHLLLWETLEGIETAITMTHDL